MVVVNVAVQVLLAFIVISHVVFDPQDEQSPAQPEKVEPEEDVVVRVTVEPVSNVFSHTSPQSNPACDPKSAPAAETVPEPLPDFVTVNVFGQASIGTTEVEVATACVILASI